MVRHNPSERDLGPAVMNGVRGRCPHCGTGRLYGRFLAVEPRCADCGEALHHHRADDAPAWATMLLVGHLMIPLIMALRTVEGLPVLFHSLFWPAVAGGLCVLLLPRVKGAVIAYQWAHRMHGFGEPDAPRG
jgi:uncharacterized protein (DUF983 family)